MMIVKKNKNKEIEAESFVCFIILVLKQNKVYFLYEMYMFYKFTIKF